MSRRRLALGLVLIGASAPLLVLSALEWRVSARLEASYRFRQILTSGQLIGPRAALETAPASLRVAATSPNRMEIRFANHRVEILDALASGDRSAGPVPAPVQVLVDGQDWSSPASAEIRADAVGLDRYHGWLAAWLVTRLDTGTTRLAIVQRVNGATLRSRGDSWRFRILWVGERPHVDQEAFGLADRRNPPYRWALLNSVVPMTVGAYAQAIPMVSLLSFVYPWLTALTGLVIVLLELASFLYERHGRHRGRRFGVLKLKGSGQ